MDIESEPCEKRMHTYVFILRNYSIFHIGDGNAASF